MRWIHVATGLVVAAIGVIALQQALELTFRGAGGVPGPGFLPVILSVGLIALGVLFAATRFFGWPAKPEQLSFPNRVEITRAGGVWLGFTASVPLVKLIGFIPAALLLVGFIVVVVERHYNVGAAATIVLIPLVTYLLFVVLLKVQLPSGFGG